MSAVESTEPGFTIDDQQLANWLEDAFARFQSELLGTLFYLVGNREDAQDALQEAFCQMLESIENELPQIQNLKAWIFQVALNTGRDIRTTAWRRRRLPLAEGRNHVTFRQGRT